MHVSTCCLRLLSNYSSNTTLILKLDLRMGVPVLPSCRLGKHVNKLVSKMMVEGAFLRTFFKRKKGKGSERE